jgi:hypothetical protein
MLGILLYLLSIGSIDIFVGSIHSVIGSIELTIRYMKNNYIENVH